ncbi:MAG: hypothetical protein R6X08_05030 [Desulfosalsimonadaceae bacterium]
MGFLRKQEEKFAAKLLEWRYKQQQIPMPARENLNKQAARIVTDAHEIAKKRGGNVWSIIKDMMSSSNR